MAKKTEIDEVLTVQKKIDEKSAEIKGIKDTIEAEREKSVGLASSGHDLETLRRRLEDAKAARALGADTGEVIAELERDLSEAETATESLANAHKKAMADFDAVSAGLGRVLAQAEEEMKVLKQAWNVGMERFLRAETERAGTAYADAVIAAEKALRQMSCLAELHNKWFLAGSAEIRPVFANMIFVAPMWHLPYHEEVKTQSPFGDPHIWKFPLDGGWLTWGPQGIAVEKERILSMGVNV